MQLLCEKHLAFSIEDGEYGNCNIMKFDIDTGQAQPVSLKPRRVSFHTRADIEKEVQSFKQEGVIREASSPWTAPLVMVKKKNGEWRMADVC